MPFSHKKKKKENPSSATYAWDYITRLQTNSVKTEKIQLEGETIQFMPSMTIQLSLMETHFVCATNSATFRPTNKKLGLSNFLWICDLSMSMSRVCYFIDLLFPQLISEQPASQTGLLGLPHQTGRSSNILNYCKHQGHWKDCPIHPKGPHRWPRSFQHRQ